MNITEDQRSMIASVLAASGDCSKNAHVCLCCGPDALALCRDIVGPRHAESLRTFAYESLGCGFSEDADTEPMMEDHYLARISELRVL